MCLFLTFPLFWQSFLPDCLNIIGRKAIEHCARCQVRANALICIFGVHTYMAWTQWWEHTVYGWEEANQSWCVDSQKSVNSLWLLFYFCKSCLFEWPEFKTNPRATKYHVARVSKFANGYFLCSNIILISNSNPLMSKEWHKVTELSYLDSE